MCRNTLWQNCLRVLRQHRNWTVVALGASLVLPGTPAPVRGAEPEASAEADGPVDPQQARVKLKYVSSSWSRVLQDVADQSGSKLVMDRVPTGNFTRLDRREYSRTEAVRIINNEIESKGFRLLEKGEFLFLIDLPSTRPRYQPAVIHPTAPPAPFGPGEPVRELQTASPYQRSFRPVRESSQGMVAQPDPEPLREEPQSLPPRPRREYVQTVQHEELANEPSRKIRPRVSAAFLEEEPAAPVEPTVPGSETLVYKTRRQTPTELSRAVYKTFKSRAKLADDGREGLPAFHVFAPPVEGDTGAEPQIQFSVAIDEENGELLIDAEAKQAQSVAKLFKLLDNARPTAAPKLVASSSYVCQIAAQLPSELNELREAQGNAPARVALAQLDEDAAVDRAFAAQEGGTEPPAAEAPAETPRPATGNPKVDEVLGNLKGEVNIEAVQDLGVLILRGNEKDVEQVMRVIRELEKLSEAASPEVHLMYLRNVDSNALATLLTTVYEQLAKFPGRATQPRQAVAVIPVSKPNAILIVAPAADLPSIQELAEELDQPVDPQTEFQVFWLKSSIATKVATLITDFYDERTGLDARPLVVADSRANAIIVRARPRDLDEITTLVEKLDKDEAGAVSKLQIFPLKNAVATEMAQVLNAAIQSVLSPPTSATSGQGGALAGVSAGQVSDEFRDARSAVLEFLAIDGASEKKLRSGILSDIRITPDTRTNSLVVSAPEQSLSLLGELIRALDRPTSAVAEIKVFTLANADAQLMVTQLQALFTNQAQGGNNQRAGNQLGVQIAGAEDANSGLIPLKFSVDTRTNSVIAVGGAEALQVVEAIMLRLDESDLRTRKNAVYRLKNSPAQYIAQSLTTFLQSQQQLAQNDPNLTSSVEQLEREVIVVAETVSNSLLISATPRYFDNILLIIEKLDAAPQQVVIQALLVEVELNNNDEFGVELGFQDSVLFNRSSVANPIFQNTTQVNQGGTVTTQRVLSQDGVPGYNFANPSLGLGNNTSLDSNGNPSHVASQGLSNFSLGRVNGDLGYGGLVMSAGSESVSVLLRALSATRRIQVLSRPQIRTMDNQQAQIIQGQVVPIVNGINLIGPNAIPSPQITQQEAGIILNVTPRINPDGQIVMYVNAEKSAFRVEGVPLFTDGANGNTIESPIRDISSAVTTVSVPSGQTVVIGGMITSSNETNERKVPWLGDVPIIGYAFRYDSRATRRTELLIFLTPRLVRDDIEAEIIKDVEMARMHFIESELEEIHGPLRSVPAEEVMPGDILPYHPASPDLVPPLPAPPEPGTPPSPQPLAPPATDMTSIKDPAVKTVSHNEEFWENELRTARTEGKPAKGDEKKTPANRSRIPWRPNPQKSK